MSQCRNKEATDNTIQRSTRTVYEDQQRRCQLQLTKGGKPIQHSEPRNS